MKRNHRLFAMLFLIVFVFSFGMAISIQAQDEDPHCCTIAPSEWCSGGKGEWYSGSCHCNTFYYPRCSHLCPVCW